MDIRIVKCSMDDLQELRNISKDTFSDAFKIKNNPEEFKVHMDYAFSKQKITFELLNPNSQFYFAYLDKELIGYMKLNYNDAQTEHFYPNAVELERLYVKTEYQNKGIGEIMLQFAIKKAKERNPPFIWLGVWQDNPAALRFYERYGFEIFDTHPYFIGNDKQTDWLLKLDF